MISIIVAGASVATSAALSVANALGQQETKKELNAQIAASSEGARNDTVNVVQAVAPAVKELASTMDAVNAQVTSLQASQTDSVEIVQVPIIEQLAKTQQAIEDAKAQLRNEHGPIAYALTKASEDIAQVRSEVGELRTSGDVAVQKVHADVTTALKALEDRLAKVSGTVPNLSKHVQIGQHVHFNHPNGSTYIRPAAANNTVYVADMGGDKFNAGRGAFVQDNSATFVRAGDDQRDVFLGDKATRKVIISPEGKQHVQIGAHTHFNASDGNTYVRSGVANKDVVLGGTGSAGARRVTVQAADGLCIGKTCVDEAALVLIKGSLAPVLPPTP
jgi:urease beta subunit